MIKTVGKSSAHGGAVFDLLTNPCDPSEAQGFVCADVLDAWFDPSPLVLEALARDTGWMARTAPPADSSHLRSIVAKWQRIDEDTVALGAGSSDLIYRFFTRYLSARSNVFLLDPTYSEYRHVCEHVVGCRVDSAADFSGVDESHDLVVVVNPNNPTGELLCSGEVERVLDRMRGDAVLWIDEAYMPFVEGGESMHGHDDARVIVCQSLSKSLALSGLRAAFLTARPDVVGELRALTPPWNINMPATIAVCAALSDPDYYRDRYVETSLLRRELCASISRLGVGTVAEGANWVTMGSTVPVADLIESCRSRKVLLRDGQGMYRQTPSNFVRIAVRGREENARIVLAIEAAVS